MHRLTRNVADNPVRHIKYINLETGEEKIGNQYEKFGADRYFFKKHTFNMETFVFDRIENVDQKGNPLKEVKVVDESHRPHLPDGHVFTFGSYEGKTKEFVLVDNPGYIDWFEKNVPQEDWTKVYPKKKIAPAPETLRLKRKNGEIVTYHKEVSV